MRVLVSETIKSYREEELKKAGSMDVRGKGQPLMQKADAVYGLRQLSPEDGDLVNGQFPVDGGDMENLDLLKCTACVQGPVHHFRGPEDATCDACRSRPIPAPPSRVLEPSPGRAVSQDSRL